MPFLSISGMVACLLSQQLQQDTVVLFHRCYFYGSFGVTIRTFFISDTVYFLLKNKDGSRKSTVYGVSCYRQIDAKVGMCQILSQPMNFSVLVLC